MVSMRKALAGIGEPAHLPFGLRAAFVGRTPSSVRASLEGMTDPQVTSWKNVGVALSIENTDDSEEAQGVATDGGRWFLSSNGSKRVVAYDNSPKRVATFSPSAEVWEEMWNDAGKPVPFPGGPAWSPHLGALAFHLGVLLVPVQGPHGVWRIDVTTGAQKWRRATVLPDSDMFPWCAVHPVTGILYTTSYAHPPKLRAYDLETLAYRPKDDIPLGSGPIYLDRVQGGTFTALARIILVRSDPNAVFCFSSLNGHCFGAKPLGDLGSSGSEVEAVTVRSWQLGGVATPVHILELDNDLTNKDDLYLHSFSVPHPSLL